MSRSTGQATPGAAGWLQARWQDGRAGWLLRPLAALFALLAGCRRGLYRARLLRARRLPVPVVVVGNITVGGAGKTPLTLYLARRLADLGVPVGIVSRGYGGSAGATGVMPVDAASDPAQVGDEPLLLARRAACPVWVGRDRAAAAEALLAAHPAVRLILCDDGLQHLRLARDVELVVVDGRRGFGNGRLLPAGPLREPLSRLRQVDGVVVNGVAHAPLALPPGPVRHAMSLVPGRLYRLDNPACEADPAALAGLRVHAIAGIGDPARFFATVAALGIDATPHAFPDHHAYTPADLDFAGCDALLMTEKDGVKCAALFAGGRAGWPAIPLWVVPVDALLDPDPAALILARLAGRLSASPAAAGASPPSPTRPLPEA